MAQQPFGIRFGKPELSGITVVAKSLVAGDVVLTIAGQSVTITLTAIGIVGGTKPQSGYVGSKVITGLSSVTKYDYSAVQNGNTITGFTWTAPNIGDDYIAIKVTCDISSTDASVVGGYTQIRAIAEANPGKPTYLLHIDDHYGYMDNNKLDDTASGGTGHKVTAASAALGNTVYDYSLGAFASFGLFSDFGNSYANFGKHADRIWCMRNCPVLTGLGDHDSGANDMGMKIKSSTSSQFTNAMVVWDAFLAPFQGDNIHAGTQAWSHTLGCLKIVCPDAITLGTGDAEAVDPWDKATDMYTLSQIDSVITAMDDSTVPFKMLLMANGIRYLTDPPTRFSSGSQYPVAGNTAAGLGTLVPAHPEYEKLMTNAGGLMSKASCNGKSGVMFSAHGDYHLAKVMRNANTDGVNDEWFYSIHVGTITGSANFTIGAINEGDTVDGSTLEMLNAGAGTDWWVVPMFVYGSREIKEIETYFYDRNNTLLWSGKCTERSMNEFIPIDYNVNANGSNGSETSGGIL